MTPHPRVGVHQVAMIGEPTNVFVEYCRSIEVAHVTLASPALGRDGELEEARAALESGSPRVACINHPLTYAAPLDRAGDEATAALIDVVGMATELGSPAIYLVTGARGALSWEAAARRFAELVEPARAVADAAGVRLLVETTTSLNAHLNIAHTVADTVAVAQQAGIGLCVDLMASWFESAIVDKLVAAIDVIGLVQVSDYVLGDRAAPCRAVPGDGVIPIEEIVSALLQAGYTGVFDLELVGPRIEAEGARAAIARSVAWMTEVCTRLAV